MNATFTAVYDACVLYPAALRSLLMYLALSGLFHARWTDQIHDEWITNLLKNRPDIRPESLATTRRLMNTHAEGAMISGYEELIPALHLPDPNDRHVLAAAIHANANVIVTYNTSDFPARILKPYGIEAQHPDVFICHLFDLAACTVLTAARDQLSDLKNPPLSVSAYLKQLERLELPVTVAHLREYEEFLE